MKAFTKCDAEGATAARNMYAKLLYPSNADFKWLIKNNQIKNCEVLVRNINTVQDIWGKEISALKGKTVIGKPTVVALDCNKTPKKIEEVEDDSDIQTQIMNLGRRFLNGTRHFPLHWK